MKKTIKHKTTKEHYNKFKNISKETGLNYRNVAHVLNYNKKEMLSKYLEDKHLNNIPLQMWDSLAVINKPTILKRHGSWSLCIGVCLAKHCVIHQFLNIPFESEDK